MAVPVVTAFSDLFANVTWTALTGDATGQSPITAYNLYWNAGTGTSATTLVTSGLITSYQITPLEGGKTYYFKVTASNIYGTGADSQQASIDAIDVPAKMSIPTVTNVDTKVLVTFDAPATHSSPIT